MQKPYSLMSLRFKSARISAINHLNTTAFPEARVACENATKAGVCHTPKKVRSASLLVLLTDDLSALAKNRRNEFFW